ncbi:MAG TPA: hypothetical protein VEH76_06505 [Methylocystis sp.]|nr:hypothetical protein [Methylocystis sp.]
MRFSFVLLTLVVVFLAACQANRPRVVVDTSDGQPLPQGALTAGGSQQWLTRSVTMASGGKTRLAFWSFVNPDCSNFGYVGVREAAAPENGELIIKQTEDFGYWAPSNPRSACNKIRVPGVLIELKAKPGFVGVDHVAYDLFFPNGGARHVEITVNVR